MNSNNKEAFSSPDYRRSRTAYVMESAFEYFITLLVADSFLAKLLSSIGLSDSLIGVVSSLISLAFLFQLVAIFVVQRVVNVKRFVVFFHAISHLIFMALYFIPFMPWALPYKEVLVFVCILAAYFGKYLVNSILYKWANSFVDPDHRATFSAGKEVISLASGIVMTLVLGQIMDAFEASDNLNGGFIFAAIAILIFNACDVISLLSIKKNSHTTPETQAPAAEKIPLGEVMKNTLGNKSFRSVIILTVLWDVARYTTIGFLGTYRIQELAFTLGTVQIINIAGNLGRIIFSRPFGKYSDKHSFAKGMELAMILCAIAFAFNVITTPATRWLVIGYSIFFNIAMAGSNQNMLSITYSYVDSKYFVQASAIKNSIGGLCGFGASLLASKLLSYIQENNNTIFGIKVYGQQVLALISLVIVVIAIFYTHFVIGKQKVMKQ